MRLVGQLVLGDGSPQDVPGCRLPYVEIVHRDFEEAQLRYHVVLLRNIDPDALLDDPVTAVFAPLGRCQASQRLAVVREAIVTIRDSGLGEREVERLSQCLRGFAGFRIRDTDTIDRVLVKELSVPIEWKESSTVGPLLIEAEQRGKVQGLLEALFGPDPRIDTELVDRLVGVPDLNERARQASSLDDLLAGLPPVPG